MYFQNFKKAFTMIELIFVIVIIGILASVVIPKLVATRDDAVATQIIHNLKSYLKDVHNYYITRGKSIYMTAPVSQVTEVVVYVRPNCTGIASGSIPGSTFYLCSGNTAYVQLGGTDPNKANHRIIFTAINTGTVVGSILGNSSTFKQMTEGTSDDPYAPASKSYLIESSDVDFD